MNATIPFESLKQSNTCARLSCLNSVAEASQGLGVEENASRFLSSPSRPCHGSYPVTKCWARGQDANTQFPPGGLGRLGTEEAGGTLNDATCGATIQPAQRSVDRVFAKITMSSRTPALWMEMEASALGAVRQRACIFKDAMVGKDSPVTPFSNQPVVNPPLAAGVASEGLMEPKTTPFIDDAMLCCECRLAALRHWADFNRLAMPGEFWPGSSPHI